MARHNKKSDKQGSAYVQSPSQRSLLENIGFECAMQFNEFLQPSSTTTTNTTSSSDQREPSSPSIDNVRATSATIDLVSSSSDYLSNSSVAATNGDKSDKVEDEERRTCDTCG